MARVQQVSEDFKLHKLKPSQREDIRELIKSRRDMNPAQLKGLVREYLLKEKVPFIRVVESVSPLREGVEIFVENAQFTITRLKNVAS